MKKKSRSLFTNVFPVFTYAYIFPPFSRLFSPYVRIHGYFSVFFPCSRKVNKLYFEFTFPVILPIRDGENIGVYWKNTLEYGENVREYGNFFFCAMASSPLRGPDMFSKFTKLVRTVMRNAVE